MSPMNVALLGMAGAAVPEVMRVVATLRTQHFPTRYEMLASLALIGLGLGVLLFDNTAASALQIAVLGAAFPQLFSGLVSAATASPAGEPRRGANRRTRDPLDYVAWRI
jgi:hypothetical protein